MRTLHIKLLATYFFLLLGSAQAYLSLRLPGGLGISAAEPGPGLFPFMTGSLMCIAAIINLAQALQQQLGDRLVADRGIRNIMLLVLVIAAYIVLLPRIGFSLAAFLLLAAALQLFGMPGLWRRLLLAAMVTLVATGVFAFLLDVVFPEPSWLM